MGFNSGFKGLNFRHCVLAILQDTKVLDTAQDSVGQVFKVTIYIYDYSQITGCKLGQL